MERVGEGHDYEIAAGGSDTTVCMHVTEETSSEGGVFVPGADGSSGSIPEYELTATVDDGVC
ncbi:hypothetical protein [Streptomyces sp. NPDC060322]|uniref:hypothetical protein n=1 Tax=unclassified Streptomyces TaxID=2593676 RepID=UPI00364F485E